ncbi:hypothetical protein BGZ76_007230 [Entomortierella beljakovae]|nr:hypothetical protein BGZ76_007230 [Entomortierella beljakovae]
MTEHQYQLFQLADKIEEVCVSSSDIHASNAKSVLHVSLQDIKDVFPNALRFKLDGNLIPFLKDSHGIRIEPWRIEFYPDKILEVVPSDTNSRAKSFTCWMIFMVKAIKHKRLSKRLWRVQESNNRLTLIQSKVEAILTQNYELLEYTIPRLFIVLPETVTSWDPTTMVYTKFRLHFICECGDHTKTSGGKIPPLHLANHEGYVVKKPTQFFERYGPYLMTMLEMVKLGTSIAGRVVPAIAPFEPVSSKIIEGVDYSLKYLETSRSLLQISGGTNVEGDINAMSSEFSRYLTGIEGLEGMELRQLGSYLESNNTDNLLGNLYRMTTKEGHVKWVCRNHYRTGYQEMNTQKLREEVYLAGGVFDEQPGSIKVNLKSSFRAVEFYDAIDKSKAGVYDLDITLDWNCTKTDLEAFERALRKSSVSILRLDLQRFQPTINHQRFQSSIVSKFLSTSARYEILARIIEHVEMKMIHVVLSKGFVKLSSLKPQRVSHLHKLSLEMIPGEIETNDFRVLVNSLKTNIALVTLNLKGNKIGNGGALALSEALRTNTTLTTLDLEGNSIGNEGALALSETLKTNTTLVTLNLKGNSIGTKRARALLEALKTNTTLTYLYLGHNSVGNEGALVLSEALKTNATLTTLDLYNNLIGTKGALALSEALKINTTLSTLDLRNNSIGNEGTQALSNANKTKTILTTLYLYNNSIGDEGDDLNFITATFITFFLGVLAVLGVLLLRIFIFHPLS